MNSNWIETTLGEIAEPNGGIVDGPFGSNLPASCYVAEGIPVIRGSNLFIGIERFRDSDYVYVSEETLKRLKRSEALPDDIIFTKKGTLGQTGLVPNAKTHARYLVSSNQMRLRVNKKLANPHYVYYYVSSRDSYEKIQRDSEFTGVPKINLGYLKKFPIKLPPSLHEQNRIAEILDSFEDKIELNRQVNQTLEQMAQAIFKSWFVDFDPVKAKAQSGDPEAIAQQLSLSREILDLFPSEFEDSELGPIPKGWKVKKLNDVVELSKESLTPSDFPSEVFDHFSIPAYDQHKLPMPETGESIKSNKYLVKEKSILLSKLNPRLPRCWMPKLRSGARSICSTEFLVITIKTKFSREYLYSLFNSRPFIDTFATLVTGTSGSHQRVKPESLYELKVVEPFTAIIDQFTNKLAPSFKIIELNREQTRTLSSIRDNLLPKLISGEISLVEHGEIDVKE